MIDITRERHTWINAVFEIGPLSFLLAGPICIVIGTLLIASAITTIANK